MVPEPHERLSAPRSLATRILVAATVLLTLFLGMTFVALDLAFRRAAEQALEDVLDSQVLGLLTAADERRDASLELPAGLPETRFSRPGSGLYARVTTDRGEPVWLSPSAIGLVLPESGNLDPGRPEYRVEYQRILPLNRGLDRDQAGYVSQTDPDRSRLVGQWSDLFWTFGREPLVQR